MSHSEVIPELTAEQQAALDAHGGVVQGRSFVLMRTDAVLSYFGFDSSEELRRKLQPAFEQVGRGELQDWSLDEFLSRMHRQHNATRE